jgi:hypothetical protein
MTPMLKTEIHSNEFEGRQLNSAALLPPLPPPDMDYHDKNS